MSSVQTVEQLMADHMCLQAENAELRQRVAELERKAEKDSIYRRAMENMAKQFVCPRMTAEELAMAQLKDRPNA